jgi:DNA-binding GntR family transcriptional regulator
MPGQADDTVERESEKPDGNGRGGLAFLHDQLRAAILNGGLEAGAVLSQVQLANRFGVSRTPLREVLRLLEREGLVEAKQNRRVRVTPFSLDDLEEIYASRIVLEALAVRLTVPVLTEENLDEMTACLEAMRRDASHEDYERWEVPHRRFHQLTVRNSGVRLGRQLEQLSDHAERYRRMYTTQVPRAWSTGLIEHQSVLDACRARDQDGAVRALVMHLGRTAVSALALVRPDHEPVRVRTALRMFPLRDGDSLA